MDFKLKNPDMVQEAAKTGGKNVVVEIVFFLGVFFVSMIFEVIGLLIIYLPLAMVFKEAEMIGSLFATAFMILIPCLFCKLIQKRKMTTLGFKKSGMWKEYGIGLLIGFAMMGGIVLIAVLTKAIELQFNPEITTFYGLLNLIVIFIGFLIQGMSEEVLCRGYFLVSLGRRKCNMWMAIVLSSLAFGALHLGNAGIAPLAFLNLVLFGIFAGVYFVKRGNIWGIAAIHSIWNFTQGNIFGVLVSGQDSGTTIFTSTIDESKSIINGGDFGLEGGILTTIVMVVGILIMLQTKQKDVAKEE